MSPDASPSDPRTPTLRLDADGVADALAVDARPGSLLLGLRPGSAPIVLAAGRPEVVDALPAATARVRLSGVLIPALVNAHTHLDLTHIGPRPHDPADGFGPWLAMIMASRAADEATLVRAMRDGVERSLRGGVAAVGDIAGGGATGAARVVLDELRRSPLVGVCFAEFFGMGRRQPAAIERARALLADDAGNDPAGVTLGLSAHAPYSAGLSMHRALAALPAPFCTHLAESPEEREFVDSAGRRGLFHDLILRLGLWNDAIPDELPGGAHAGVAAGASPVALLTPAITGRRPLVAHANDLNDADIALLAAAGASVVWCPRGHAYFGRSAAFGPHRWRDLSAAGVNVCLGTDSIVNLPPAQADRISPMDEARVLRDDADPRTLLAMITTNAALALGLDPARFAFSPGEVAGVALAPIADAAARRGATAATMVMATDDPISPVLIGTVALHPALAGVIPGRVP